MSALKIQCNVRLEAPVKHWLDQRSASMHLSRNWLINNIIKKEMENTPNKSQKSDVS